MSRIESIDGLMDEKTARQKIKYKLTRTVELRKEIDSAVNKMNSESTQKESNATIVVQTM